MPYTTLEQRTAYKAKWAAKNPEKQAAYTRSYQEKAVIPIMLNRVRNRAKTSGLVFDLVAADITIPEVCPILGIPLKRNVGGGRMQDGSPSLDRIDSQKGYVKGNVWVISALANQMKNDASPEMLRKFAEWVLR
jgi:hypothetical protein